MGRLPLELEEKRRRLAHAVQRGAFDSYIRHGRVPETYSRIAELASEAKNLGDGVALPTPGVSRLPSGRPTNHYTWRTAGDHKVRNAHAALNGRVFCWANPPEHGHPGSEPNCRCWPEPYYGDPTVPDALLALARQLRWIPAAGNFGPASRQSPVLMAVWHSRSSSRMTALRSTRRCPEAASLRRCGFPTSLGCKSSRMGRLDRMRRGMVSHCRSPGLGEPCSRAFSHRCHCRQCLRRFDTPRVRLRPID